jgi:soluble lytic murein transglycosylase-like protein
MKRIFVAVAVVMVALLGGAPAMAQIDDSSACASAAALAEQAGGLPSGLLLSIGMVESGRADPLSGHVAPWPWTVNVDGAGRYFSSESDAAAFVRLAQSSGARDIDVGCFQVSLQAHPLAFASVDDAFEPQKNAAYAVAFLKQLKGFAGSWEAAVADYHSATPALGLPYAQRVMAVWKGAPLSGGGVILALTVADPAVILQSPAARAVKVYTMNDPPGAGLRHGLPRVISP